MKSHKYQQINDKEWLIDLYINQHKSAFEIGQIIGCKNSNTVRQSLIDLGIVTRNRSEANRIDYPITINDEVITGSLLGDAGLRIYNRNSEICIPYLSKGNIHLEHVEYFAKFFYPTTYKEFITPESYTNKKNGKTFHSFTFRTYANEKLKPYIRKWYPDGIKIIPKDINITPMVLLQWFMDDGCCYYGKTKKSWFPRINFSSQSFTKTDNQRLVEQINDKFHLDAFVARCAKGTHWLIKLSGYKSSERFFDLVGPTPVKAFNYKWKSIIHQTQPIA